MRHVSIKRLPYNIARRKKPELKVLGNLVISLSFIRLRQLGMHWNYLRKIFWIYQCINIYKYIRFVKFTILYKMNNLMVQGFVFEYGELLGSARVGGSRSKRKFI